METAPETPRTVNVHSTPTRILAAVAWAFCAFLAVNLLLTGTAASIWRFLPWLLLAAWSVYVLLWRPCLLVGRDSLVVRNILRDHTIPFSELRAVRVVQTAGFETTAGRIASWGAPGAARLRPRHSPGTAPGMTGAGARNSGPRSAGMRKPGPRSSSPVPGLPHTQAAVETAWNAWEHRNPGDRSVPRPDTPGKVTVRWDLPSAVVGVIVVVLVAGTLI